MARGQRLLGPRNQFVTFGMCYSYAFGSTGRCNGTGHDTAPVVL